MARHLGALLRSVGSLPTPPVRTNVGDCFWSEEGQGLAEYSLILALIAIVAIVALAILGTQISSMLSYIGSVV